MANEISRPWQGRTSQGALGDAGPYTAVQWAEMYARMIGNGAEKANRGIFRGVENELEVTPNSPAAKNVLVETGSALVQGRFYYNAATQTLTIDDNASGSTRIDTIILEADYTAQTVRLDVLKGTPGAGLQTLTQSLGTIWQIPLAYITLASGFTSVTASMITDMREYANLPANIALDVTNSSGTTLENGAVAIWLPVGGAAIDDTTTEGSANVAGVIERRTTNGAAARVIIAGIHPVICDESVVVGDYLETSTTSGQAQKVTVGTVFARVLTANTGAGTRALCLIAVPLPVPTGYKALATHDAAQSFAVVTAYAILFNTETYDYGSLHNTASNSSRFVAVLDGFYRFEAYAEITTTGGGTGISMFFRINGVANNLATFLVTSVGSGIKLYAQITLGLSANDYVEVFVQTDAPTTRQVDSNARSPFMRIEKL